MASQHIHGLRAAAGVAIASLCIVATAQATDQTLSIDVNRWQSPLPYLMVTVTSTNAQFKSGQEYAGVFGGYSTAAAGGDIPANRWDVFCAELNQDIMIGSTYTFNIWNDVVAMPIPTGTPQNGGPQISWDQKLLIKEAINNCLGFAVPMGMQPQRNDAQSLLGFYHNGNSPAVLTDQLAAATQLLIWEIIHENWNYGTVGADARGSVPLSQYDPAWMKMNENKMDLNSGWLVWSYPTSTDIYGNTVEDYFYGNPNKTFNGNPMVGLKQCALDHYYQAVPEATTVLLSGIAAWPFLIARRRKA